MKTFSLLIQVKFILKRLDYDNHNLKFRTDED